ncbi:MAG: S8 family serine peptidase, partial [Thermomicrobiales bacterium]|nr:S8 family serine peptidase [Thermomicrobiales bacterium]
MIHWSVRAVLALVLALTAAAAVFSPIAEPAAATRDTKRAADDVAIVMLADGVDPVATARELGVMPLKVYRHVFSGFAARMPATAARAARNSPRVRGIAPDLPLSGAAQTTSTGIARIGLAHDAAQAKTTGQTRRAGAASGARQQETGRHAEPGQRAAESAAAAGKDASTAKKSKKAKKHKKHKKHKSGKHRKTRNGRTSTPPINGNGVNADVAILDSGVDRLADLNVVAQVSCNGAGPACVNGGGDLVGHGTHVAGIIGARDNDIGVLGVAPGVRIWSVRVLGADNMGQAADAIAGLDWVYQHRGTIDVVNMSLGGPGRVTPCGSNNRDGYHAAICRVTAAGIPVVVAAGNQGSDIDRVNAAGSAFVPAAYPEAIAVSAMADTDGLPGGLGPIRCGEHDDTLATFSNYGRKVAIAAPAVCITSLDRQGG